MQQTNKIQNKANVILHKQDYTAAQATRYKYEYFIKKFWFSKK